MLNKLRILFIIFLLFWLSDKASAIIQTQYQSGFQEITIMDDNRPLQISVWYPTLQQHPNEKIGESIVFKGENAVKNSKIEGDNHPLVLISHGFGGSWINQVWLAAALSRHGYIVAAPNHPGTTTQNMNRMIAQNMLERPNDIRRTLSYLLTNKSFSAVINSNKVGLVGHSYGGWTAIELIGGRFSANKFEQFCKTYSFLDSCKIYQQQMQGVDKKSDYFNLDKNMLDPRISSAFIFDIGFANGFIPNSLSKINVPTLVISTGDFDKRLPADLESQYLIQNMPSNTTEYISLDKATHFSFTGLCKKNAITILKKEKIDDSYICKEDMKQRQAIHQWLVEKIISYID